MLINAIVATDLNNAIGKDGKLPWINLPKDMAYFKKMTEGHPVIMGRKTWDSIPNAYKPLPNRINIVISRTLNMSTLENVFVVSSIHEAIKLGLTFYKDIFIIGGGGIYKEAMPFINTIYKTKINTIVEDPDTYFPILDKEKWCLKSSISEVCKLNLSFEIYERTIGNNSIKYYL